MFLGIEIGGTKLQLGVGSGDQAQLAALERLDVVPQRGAAGIMEQIEQVGSALVAQHDVTRVGFAFGGPVDAAAGRVIKSHQIAGWDDVPLVDWCRQTLGRPAVLENDCNSAALAEARFGAGRGHRAVFYITVGTGIGGGIVLDGKVFGSGRPAVTEIGHLRPGLHADRPETTVESIASGWGISAAAQARIAGGISRPLGAVRRDEGPIDREELRQRLTDAQQVDDEYVHDLLLRCDSDPDHLTAKTVAQAAAEGNEVAQEVLSHACQTLGWAVAQVITLLAPDVIVIGGGVSLIGRNQFFAPLRREVRRYVFPPLADQYEVLPTQLGELAMVYGALAVAASD